jgi:hypothetical protein
MTIGNINASSLSAVSAAQTSSAPGSVGVSALKGAMNVEAMVQGNLSQMLREATPHLGQNLDIEV